jgi:glycosyltransferase involved in cell wall biosynthesis
MQTSQLSIVIASHNRRELLRRCLGALRAQSADPSRFEVIVADDGSSDGTAAMVAEFEAPFALRCLRLEKGGKSAATNAAIEAAEGHACLFLDDDIVAEPELVAGHLEAHEGGAVLGIGAIVELPPRARDWYARAFAQGWAEHNAELEHRRAHWTDTYGANFSAPTDRLREIGGFNTALAVGEDFEIGYRLSRAGCTPTFLPAAVAVHDDQKRYGKMLADARRQGAAHVELSRSLEGTRDDLLDWGQSAGARELALRRICLRLGVPARPLAWLGRFLPGEGRKMLWLHFVRRLAFWRGAMEAATATEWAALTERPSRRAETATAPLALVLPAAAELLEMAPL